MFHHDLHQRRVQVEAPHPLAGSISKRVNLFQNLAGVNMHGSRPDRVVEMGSIDSEEAYTSMQDGAMV